VVTVKTDIEMTPGNRDPSRYRKTTLSMALLMLIASGAPALSILAEFDQEKEATRLVAYQDGAKIWTICTGLTTYQGRPVVQGMRLSAEQCRQADQEFFARDLREAQEIIRPDVWARMSEPAKASLGDMVHNLGKGKAQGSSAVRLLNEGKTNEGCAAITLWIKDHGRDCRKAASNCQGQPIRRMQEDELCLIPDQEKLEQHAASLLRPMDITPLRVQLLAGALESTR
jgi:lysozyme